MHIVISYTSCTSQIGEGENAIGRWMLHLPDVNISWCRVFSDDAWQQDPSLNVLSRLTGLTSLNLRSTHFTAGLEQLGTLMRLAHLDLSLNPGFLGSGVSLPSQWRVPHINMHPGFSNELCSDRIGERPA